MRLEIKDLILRYLSEDEPDLVVENLSVDCPFCILGGGGSGKSNFIKVLAGVETIESGEIFVGGNEIGGLKPKERDVALISKNTPLFENKTVRYNLELPLKKRKQNLEKNSLAQNIAGILDKKVKELDEKTRIDILLTRASLRSPSLILIDEPNNFCVDTDYFIKRAEQILDKDKTILATYDYDLVENMFDNFVMLRSGKVIFCGTKEQLISNENPYIKAFLH